MATLISYSTSSGETRRCDAHCYNATHAKCECICKGMNHGAGKKKATENTERLADEWIKHWEQQHPGSQATNHLHPVKEQLQLFTK